MKISILILLLFLISVAAQAYDKVAISPNNMKVIVVSGEVYGTNQGTCTTDCTNQCLEERQG
ncbi:MAG: hypothetical protein QW165_02065 [Candidatus Woesearchaeota archaeon]